MCKILLIPHLIKLIARKAQIKDREDQPDILQSHIPPSVVLAGLCLFYVVYVVVLGHCVGIAVSLVVEDYEEEKDTVEKELGEDIE